VQAETLFNNQSAGLLTLAALSIVGSLAIMALHKPAKPEGVNPAKQDLINT